MNTLNGYSKSTLTDKYVLTAAGGHLEFSSEAAANTLVQRNANQYVYATYFNSAISDEALTDIGSIYVRNTSDTFIRRISKSQFYSIIDNKFVTLDTAQTITGIKTFSVGPILANNTTITQNQASTSNYTTAIRWLKGGTSQGTHNPSIGHHNTGGDGTGSICILPYPTEKAPWDGTVGLFIKKDHVYIDSKELASTANGSTYFTAFSGGEITSSGNTLVQADHSITIGGQERTAGSSTCNIINSLAVSTVTSSAAANLTLGITVNGVVSANKTITDLYAASIRVKDVRSQIRQTTYWENKTINFWFNNTGTPSSIWYSGITVKGWTDDYQTWEIASGSTNSLNGNLYYRNGLSGAWQSWQRIVFASELPRLFTDFSNAGSQTTSISIGGTTKTLKIDADMLDGYHANGLLTSVSSSTGTNLSITVGGTTKSISDLYSTFDANGNNISSFYLPRRRMTNPSTGTSYHGAIPFIIALKGAGTPIYDDPEFKNGNNNVYAYNNSGSGAVTVSRISDDQGSSNSSGYILQISTTTGTASPGRGGFYQNISSRQNAVFAQIFRAKIPTGFSVVAAENPMGNGKTTYWLTDTAGTGKWEWYVRITQCGNGGSYSTGGHVYLSGSGEVTWYLAYCNLIDLTKGNYDGLRAKYSDITTNIYVNQNTSDNIEYPLVWSNQNNTNSALSNQLYKSYSHLTYNPSIHRISTGQYIANNSVGPHFTANSTPGNWAYLRLHNGSTYWDIATRSDSGSGGLWLARLSGADNGIFVSTNNNVGISTSTPADKLHVNGGYARIAANGKYLRIGPQDATYAHYETDANTSHLFNKRVDVNGAIWVYNTNYGIAADGKFYAHTVYANHPGSSTTGGVSLYSNSDPMTYGIAFRGTGTYGTHGYVTADWATYLTMSNTNNRGWIFRRASSANVFSIDTSGQVYANGRINGSYFISRVETGTQPYACTSTTLNTNLNADMLDNYHAGVSNNKVAIYVPFPNDNTLVSLGYNTEANKNNTEAYLKGICKWAINNYAGNGKCILIGSAEPNSSGTLILHLYSSSGKDSETGLPMYCEGVFFNLGGNAYTFGTNNYVWKWSHSTWRGTALTATKLQTARTINGTSFDGSTNITTTQWGTARNISIADSDNTNTGTAVSVNGSTNVTLKLPETIKATLTGNASSATKLQTARMLWGQPFDGTNNVNGHITMNGEYALKAYMPRKKEGGGGWEYKPFMVLDEANTDFAHIGVCGNNDTLNYIYIGSNSYSSNNNLRIYPDGRVYTGGNVEATRFISNIATGTSPLSVTSTTLCNNLNADMLDGYHLGKDWGTIPFVGPSGVMDVGKYIDFHNAKGESLDYSTRLEVTGQYQNTVSLPNRSGTLALTIDNVASATKLQTARTLWGQSFDGTANVSGNMISVGQITFLDLTGTNSRALLYQKMADSDYFRIYVGGTASNSGYAEIATAQSGDEPIYVRQYTGVFSTIKRTLTLLDSSGNSSFPGNITTTGLIYATHFYENSDVRLKHNIELIHDSSNIPEIKQFDWKESGEHSYGLIAQELEQNGYSELVSVKDDGYKTVNYSAALSLIVGKLQVKIRELEKEIENLKNQN